MIKSYGNSINIADTAPRRSGEIEDHDDRPPPGRGGKTRGTPIMMSCLGYPQGFNNDMEERDRLSEVAGRLASAASIARKPSIRT
jgi:hypothetical protein